MDGRFTLREREPLSLTHRCKDKGASVRGSHASSQVVARRRSDRSPHSLVRAARRRCQVVSRGLSGERVNGRVKICQVLGKGERTEDVPARGRWYWGMVRARSGRGGGVFERARTFSPSAPQYQRSRCRQKRAAAARERPLLPFSWAARPPRAASRPAERAVAQERAAAPRRRGESRAA